MPVPSLPRPASLSPWISPPRLRIHDAEDRRATWLELFFDLIFVAAVAQIATGLVADHSAGGFVEYVAVFIPVAWAWMGFAFYANRFDTDDVIYRLMMALGMLAVGALAVNSIDATGANAAEFAVSYAAVRFVLVALYVRAYRHVEGRARAAAGRFVAGFTAGAVLWLASSLLDSPERFVLWGVGFAIELATPFVTWGLLGRGVAPIHVQHLEERFGLFTIIVLGESVLAVVLGTDLADFGLSASLTALAAFIAAVCVWWIYFDFADTSAIRQGRRGFVYVYGHLLLFAGVAALGVGAELAIEEASADGLGAGARWALCGGLALYLVCLAALHAAVRTSLRESIVLWRLGAAAALIALAAAGGVLAPPLLVALAAVLVLTQLAVEATCTRIDCVIPAPQFEVTLPRPDASVAEPSPTAESGRDG